MQIERQEQNYDDESEKELLFIFDKTLDHNMILND